MFTRVSGQSREDARPRWARSSMPNLSQGPVPRRVIQSLYCLSHFMEWRDSIKVGNEWKLETDVFVRDEWDTLDLSSWVVHSGVLPTAKEYPGGPWSRCFRLWTSRGKLRGALVHRLFWWLHRIFAFRLNQQTLDLTCFLGLGPPHPYAGFLSGHVSEVLPFVLKLGGV